MYTYQAKYDTHYGLKVLGDYAIAFSYEEVEEAVKESVKDLLWAFNADFLTQYIPLSEKVIKILQKELHEDFNDEVLELISEDNLYHLIKDAISLDGEGHFLAPYDFEMIEIPSYTVYSPIERDNHELKDLLEAIQYEFCECIDKDEDYIYLFRID